MSTLTFPVRSGGRAAQIHIDLVTLGLLSVIVLLGLVMVTSASMSIATRDGGDPLQYLRGQASMVAAGMFIAMIAFAVRTEWLERWSSLLLLLAIVLLVLVAIPGVGYSVNGARRWLRIAGFNLQVSELTRIMVLVWVASYAVRREAELQGSLIGMVKPLSVLALIAGLLLLEPDFGAAVVLVATGFGVLFIAGARLRDVIGLSLVVTVAMAAIAMLEPYRVRRLLAFLDPWADQFNSGFQLVQSLIAIGRGGWTGVGLGESVQKLFYLPEAHTDFVFAVLAEELGLLGILLTLALFFLLACRALWIAKLAHDSGLKFQCYIAAGFGIWLGLQAFVNIGVNMGALPTKGLTLPFISYGRSSMLAGLAWVGMLLRVFHEAAIAARGPAAAALRGGSARSVAEVAEDEALLADGARP
jgi:cell division protein FtsW